MNNHLILIGFMGVGKTVVGRQLSKKLGLSFCDLDSDIVKEYGDIATIFNKKGEAFFRDIEFKAFEKTISDKAPLVVSTGGGIVTNKDSMLRLKECKNVIWLKASYQTVLKRVLKDSTNKRPLVDDQLENRFKSRQLLYESVANYTVNVDNILIQEVAEKIINRYG